MEGLRWEESLVWPLHLLGCGVITSGDLSHGANPEWGGTDQAGGVIHPPDSVLALGRRSGRFPPEPCLPPRRGNRKRVEWIFTGVICRVRSRVSR